MHTELIQTSNTLGQVADTLRVIADTMIQENVQEEVVNTVHSSSETGLIIAILGLLVFSAHLFTGIFNRRRIPDVLFLMLIGLFIGPIFHWVVPEDLGSIGTVFTGITLVLILFQSGMQLSFNTIVVSLRKTTWLLLLNYAFTTVALWLIGWLVFDYDPIVVVILGIILGGTASAVIGPMVENLRMTDGSRSILILEAAIGNVFSIVLSLALMKGLQMGAFELGPVVGQIFSSFILSIIMGIIGAIFWAVILDKVRSIKNTIMTTPAFVFIIYGLNEWMGYSGAIAALAFGLCLANIDSIYNSILKRFFTREPSQLNDIEKSLFSEITLLLKTFFFIYVGISIQISDPKLILIGLSITVLLYILRIFVVRLSISKRYNTTNLDKLYMALLNPKGLTAAVLASAMSTVIPEGETIRNIVFYVIFFSIILTSILVPLIEKNGFLAKVYMKLLGLKEEAEASEIADISDENDENE